jgi:hypothetical protein
MSNKKETPVSWLIEQWPILKSHLPERILDEALEMESKKQQKYDEMLAMLERIKKFYDIKAIHEDEYQLRYEIEQLIKEAKEL